IFTKSTWLFINRFSSRSREDEDGLLETADTRCFAVRDKLAHNSAQAVTVAAVALTVAEKEVAEIYILLCCFLKNVVYSIEPKVEKIKNY
ncbi:MAG: hypothetical protein K2H30_02470, partial [Clostridia bacterium]|nr:hypothetical protein [Clostridia bacterium]